MYILKTVSNPILLLNKQSGFTLLEVMISMSILALVFLSLFRMQSGTIELATAGRANSVFPILARQLLVKIEQDMSDFSDVKGNFNEPFERFEWTCSITDSSISDLDIFPGENQNRFKKIEVRITDTSGHTSYQITTWRVSGE